MGYEAGSIHWAPTHGDKSRFDLHHKLLIIKLVKYLARFNDIDGKYHDTTHHAHPAIHCVCGMEGRQWAKPDLSRPFCPIRECLP